MRLDPGKTEFRESAFHDVLTDIGIDPHSGAGTVTVVGDAPVLDSPLRIAEAGTLALAAQAAAIDELWQHRGGRPQDAWIDPRDVIFSLNPFPHLRRNDRPSKLWQQFGDLACRGHYETADGRFIYFVNMLPKGRDGMLRILNTINDRDAVAAAVRRWNAIELEDAMTAEGIPAAVVRTPAEWLATEQGQLLAAGGLIHLDRIADADPIALTPADRPLTGVKVLDMTHVVAGPTMARGLAEYGADVLHIATLRPDLQDALGVTTEMLIGKRSAQLELDEPADRAAFEALLREADVFIQSWRPGMLSRFGFTPERIAELRPGIVQVSVSAYGDRGPWGQRGGFDGLALASIGATAQEAARDRPKLSPPGVLTDSLVGFLGVGVVASLLLRRAAEGGSFRVDLPLARFGMWLQSLGEIPIGTPVTTDLGEPRRRRVNSAYGTLDYVAPAIRYSQLEGFLSRSPEPVGSSLPRWL